MYILFSVLLLFFLLQHIPLNYKYTLYDIGMVIEKLMGGAFRASFCRKKFRTMYNAVMKKVCFLCHRGKLT